MFSSFKKIFIHNNSIKIVPHVKDKDKKTSVKNKQKYIYFDSWRCISMYNNELKSLNVLSKRSSFIKRWVITLLDYNGKYHYSGYHFRSYVSASNFQISADDFWNTEQLASSLDDFCFD